MTVSVRLIERFAALSIVYFQVSAKSVQQNSPVPNTDKINSPSTVILPDSVIFTQKFKKNDRLVKKNLTFHFWRIIYTDQSVI